VILILTAKDADTLLPTITSRCRIVGLRPLPTSLIEIELQTRWNVPTDQAHLLAHVADGRLGWAVRAFQDTKLWETRQSQIEGLYEALVTNRVGRFAIAEQLSRKPDKLPDTLRCWLSWWRDVTLLAHANRASGGAGITNVDQRAYLERMARTWSVRQIVECFKHTNGALWQLDHNANARLVMENLFLVYPLASV
jgi:DNA polymerase-3 subunit delta'